MNTEITKTLANLVTKSQERFVWYKKQLGIVYKESNLYDDWYRLYLREMKNEEEKWLKYLQEEIKLSKIS